MFTLALSAVIGVAAGTTFVFGWIGSATTTGSSQALLTCGFTQGPGWDTVPPSGSGLAPGTVYITSSSLPVISTSSPAKTTTASFQAYGGGQGVSEYLVGEIAFLCTHLPASGTTTISISISTSGGLATSDFAGTGYFIAFVQTGTVDVGTTASTDNPAQAGNQCVSAANDNLFEPVDSTTGFSTWAYNSVGTPGYLASSGSCTLGTSSPTTSTPATGNAPPIWTISFAVVNLLPPSGSQLGTALAAFTFSFTATNQ